MMTDALAKWREENPDFERKAPRNPIQRWRESNTRKNAIDAFCWGCMGGEEGGSNEGMMALIRGCASGPGATRECPHWHWRPYK